MGNITSNQCDGFVADAVVKENTESHDESVSKLESIGLRCLIKSTDLLEAATTIKNNLLLTDYCLLSEYADSLIQRLTELQRHDETNIPLSNLIDHLQRNNNGINGMQYTTISSALQVLDIEGDGVVYIESALDMLKNFQNSSSDDNPLSRRVRTLQSCIYQPGFIDIYIKDEDRMNGLTHSKKLLHFLHRQRANSDYLQLTILRGFQWKHSTRKLVTHAYSEILKNPRKLIEKSGVLTEDVIKAIKVSSNPLDAKNLLDGNPLTYWQSEGSSGSHYIRININQNVKLLKLFINVSSSDNSYMPNTIVIMRGHSLETLREFSKLSINSSYKGDFLILQYLQEYYPIFQINILRSHSDGCNTRIRGIKAEGIKPKNAEELIPSINNSAQILLAEFLFTTAELLIEITPKALPLYVKQCSKALENIPPLSLTKFCNSENVNMFDKIHEMFFENNRIKDDIGLLLLSFNLARGHMSGIIESLYNLCDYYAAGDRSVESIDKIIKSLQHTLNMEIFLQSDFLDLNGTAGKYISQYDANGIIMFKTLEPESEVILTRLRIKMVQKNDTIKRLLILVNNDDSNVFNLNKLDELSIDKLDDYINSPENTLKAVLYRKIDEDLDDIDLPLNSFSEGRFIVIKAFGMSNQFTCNVLKVNLYGIYLENKHINGTKEYQNCHIYLGYQKLVESVLTFVFYLLRFKKTKKIITRSLKLISFYKMYNILAISVDLQMLLLKIFLLIIPDLDVSNNSGFDGLYEDLCCIVNGFDNIRSNIKQFVMLAEAILIQGANIFFSNSDERKRELIRMLTFDKSVDINLKSVELRFQSLCSYFTKYDTLSLLKKEPNEISVVHLLFKLSAIEMKNVINGKRISAYCESSTSLHSTLIAHIIFEKDSQFHEIIQEMIQLVKTFLLMTQKINDDCNFKEVVNRSEFLLVSDSFRQLMYCLMESNSVIINNMDSIGLLKSFDELGNLLFIFCKRYDPNFTQNYSNDKIETVLKTWLIESEHVYKPNENIEQTFVCPNASSFEVEFDLQCETEQKYDILEFWTNAATKTKCHGNVNTENWKTSLKFHNSSVLHFSFSSDSSNEFWGYKFKVIARGYLGSDLSWPVDMCLIYSKFCGIFCGNIISRISKRNYSECTDIVGDMLKSDLWSLLLRGGFLKQSELNNDNKKKFNSVSNFGKSTLSIENSFEVKEYIMSNDGKELVKKCKDSNRTLNIGGCDIDDAVEQTFFAIIFHSYELLRELKNYHETGKLSEPLISVYAAANGLRNHLIEERQLKKSSGICIDSNDNDNFARECRLKAQFLFEISPISAKKVGIQSTGKRTSVHRIHRLNSIGSLATRRYMRIDSSAIERFPICKNILEFVRNPNWKINTIKRLIEERENYSVDLIYIFNYIYRFVTYFGICNIISISFLQELVSTQLNWGEHYTSYLDGCGFEKEFELRKAYFDMVKIFIEFVIDNDRTKLIDDYQLEKLDYITVILLHLLDIQWKSSDIQMISEIKLADFYAMLAMRTVSIVDVEFLGDKESEELVHYKEHMLWLKQVTGSQQKFKDWFSSHYNDKDRDKQMQMFIARFCDILEVDILCDGCKSTIPGKRYRCIDCVDMDLCATCFSGGVQPSIETRHEAGIHRLVALSYKCDECQAFIIGTRVHCNQCDDFDLCWGCFIENLYPAGHEFSHAVTMHPGIIVRQPKTKVWSMASYIFIHSWLSMSALALNASSYADPQLALYKECVNQTQDFLSKLDTCKGFEEEPELPIESRRKCAVAFNSSDRLMGLLCAMLPHSNVLSSDTKELFITEKLLNLLIKLIHSAVDDHVTDGDSNCMALALFTRLLKQTTPSLADLSTSRSLDRLIDDLYPGYITIEFLFEFGVKCLKSAEIDWMHAVLSSLQSIYRSTIWREIVADVACRFLSKCDESIDNTIFALLCLSNFPQLPSIGVPVIYNQTKKGVILKYFPEKKTSLVVDIHTRQRVKVEESCLKIIENFPYVDIGHIKTCCDLITKFSKSELETDDILLFVTALALRTLNNATTNSDLQPTNELLTILVSLSSIQDKSYVNWTSLHLDIAGLYVYAAKKKGIILSKNKRNNKEAGDGGSKFPEYLSKNKKSDFFKTITDSQRKIIECMSPPPDEETLIAVRSAFSDDNDFEEALRQNLRSQEKDYNDISSDTKTSESENDVVDSPSISSESNLEYDVNPSDESDDNDYENDDFDEEINGLQFTAVCEKELKKKVSQDQDFFSFFISSEDKNKIAKPDNTTDDRKETILLPVDKCVDNRSVKHKKCNKLLHKKLAMLKKQRQIEMDDIWRVMCVRQARQLLSILLADWQGEPIPASVLGRGKPEWVPSILNVLNLDESERSFEQVIGSVLSNVDKSVLNTLSRAAGNLICSNICVKRQSERNYVQKIYNVEEIHITGVLSLSIDFDKRSQLADGDKLIFSTSFDLKENVFELMNFTDFFHDTKTLKFTTNTLYFQLVCDNNAYNNISNKFGYKMIVSAEKAANFDTGFQVLTQLINNYAEYLPICDLWLYFVHEICYQTGLERRKIIRLSIDLLKITKNSSIHVDILKLLPIWRLYCKLKVKNEKLFNPLGRALTDFFVQVEETAIDWNIIVEYHASLKSHDDILNAFAQGCNLVIYLARLFQV